jgi:glycosyltransferase involved in cell wall biosynthesis
MPKVLILCAHRPGRSPSQRYRFEQYIDYLKTKGFEFSWSFLLNEPDDKIFYSQGNALAKSRIIYKSLRQRKKDVSNFRNFDIIFIQREANFLGNSKFEQKAFESGAKVIFDFDDSIWLEDTSPGNKKWSWLKQPRKFFDNVRYAHTIIAGNEYLAEKARSVNKNVIVIPTTVETELHRKMEDVIPIAIGRKMADGKWQMADGRQKPSEVTLGWSGSISTIKHFEMLLPVLKKLKEKYSDKVNFKIIGQENYHSKDLKITSVTWNEKTEVQELNSFDIGLMPLPDDEWANGKCGLKGLTYMSCEIPTVMSNVGVNKEIIQNGVNGFLASNEKEWFEVLCKLIEDEGLRKNIGSAGRKTVLEKYSVETNKEKYLKAFSFA